MRLIFLLFLFIQPAHSTQETCTVEASISHPVTAITLDIVKNSIKFAQKESCQSILLTISTPGGSLPATRLIIQKILNSPYPFLCLISPSGSHAASAGAIILQACHVNGALKGTNMGAATPVAMGQQMEKESDMRKKVLNDTISFLETLTTLRKRNKEFGKSIVSDAKSVTAKEAYQLKAIDFLGDRKEDFLSFSEGRKVTLSEGKESLVKTGPIKIFPMSYRYSLLNFFADPQLLYLIFLGSILLIYFELTHPGILVPGIVGGIGLVLSLIGMNLMSVTWGALALVFFGLCLFAAEAFIPSFGILGIGGAVAFVLGSLYLFDPLETGGYTLPLSFILPAAIFISLLSFGVSWLALRNFKMRKDKTGFEALEGKEGEVESLSETKTNQGWVFLNGEIWRFSAVDKVQKGDTVKVLSVKGMTLIVEKVKEET